MFGWTYPKSTEVCLQKNSALLSNYFSLLHSVALLQLGDAYAKLRGIFANYLSYPRCNVVTNVPTTAVLFYAYHRAATALAEAQSPLYPLFFLATSAFYVFFYSFEQAMSFAAMFQDLHLVITGDSVNFSGVLGEIVGQILKFTIDDAIIAVQ